MGISPVLECGFDVAIQTSVSVETCATDLVGTARIASCASHAKMLALLNERNVMCNDIDKSSLR